MLSKVKIVDRMDRMSLDKKQFEVLCALEQFGKDLVAAKQIGIERGLAEEDWNETFDDLLHKGLLSSINSNTVEVTEKGRIALEPFRVKRAVIIAAGFGSRLVPITLNTPKPLVRVHGQMIIETLLDAITAAGIEEVIIVRGYLWEQFDQLLYKYPNVKFIQNPYFKEANNISSVYLAKDRLKGAYVCEADLLVSNPNIIRKYEFSTNYIGVWRQSTNDWCFDVEDGYIRHLSPSGGEDVYHMFGISYWTEEDGEKLAKCVEQVYNLPDGKQKYWDEVALGSFIDEFQVQIRPCRWEDIVEIDTYQELKAIDSIYDVKE